MGRHFQKDIILVAVGYYFRFSLSYRDIVELLRDRGITVHHTTVMRWVHHYGPIFKASMASASNSSTLKVGESDETYIRVKGRWAYLYRAIDSNGLIAKWILSYENTVAIIPHPITFVLPS